MESTKQNPFALVVGKLDTAKVEFSECYPDLHDLQKWYLETSESLRTATSKMQDVGLKIIDTRRENETSFIQFRVPEIESRTEKIARLEAQLAALKESCRQVINELHIDNIGPGYIHIYGAKGMYHQHHQKEGYDILHHFLHLVYAKDESQ